MCRCSCCSRQCWTINLNNQDIRQLVLQESRYWAFLPYDSFISQWNSNISPVGTNPSSDILAGGLPLSLAISQVDSPLPGPADVLALVVGLCVVGLAALANAGAIALPARPIYYFSNSNTRARDDSAPFPINPDNPCPFAPCADIADEIRGRVFGSKNAALNDLIRQYGSGIRTGRREITNFYNDVCPEEGWHWTIEPHRQFTFSIICCWCCNQNTPDIQCYHTG